MDIYDELAARWPSPVVARKEVGKFSGGILNPRTLANLDSLGKGPDGKFQVGPRKIAYPVNSLIIWMRAQGEK